LIKKFTSGRINIKSLEEFYKNEHVHPSEKAPQDANSWNNLSKEI